jgi:crotonobetainyl-CoA:carnitine CoA-transferase CaiB-like acyl-CoA transferase
VKAGVPLADFASGLYAAYSIAALIARVRAGGSGGHIDVPMFAATLGISALQTSEYFGTGRDPRKLGSAHPRNAPYQAYEAADGHFAIAAGNQKLWASVCEVVGQIELMADARYANPTLRARHQAELAAQLEPAFAREPAAHWLAAFAAAGVPCAPINGYGAALADPQAAHLQLVRSQELPGGHATRTVGCPVRLDGRVPEVDTRPPGLSEHAAELRAQAVTGATAGEAPGRGAGSPAGEPARARRSSPEPT